LLPVGDTIISGLARNSIQTVVELPKQPVESVLSSEEEPSSTIPLNDGMEEYQRLKQELQIFVAALTLAIGLLVWLKFGLNLALNYLLGGLTGLIYIRMLAREVERLGDNRRLNSNRIALVAGVIILATQVPKLHVLPVFLGFLTYKAALLLYALRIAVFPTDNSQSKSDS
jgi:ATP synthase protein I